MVFNNFIRRLYSMSKTKKSRIVIPEGFEIICGSPFTGKNLEIKDQDTGSIYLYLSSKLAIEKINKALDELYRALQKSKDSPKISEVKYARCAKYANEQKSKMALKQGVFWKIGSSATFRF